MFVSSLLQPYNKDITTKIQGPSIESWSKYHDVSQSGDDRVTSIRCHFWPSSAAEWVGRPRQYGLPTRLNTDDISRFGFHLVPVGHPLSATKSTEWRISFSVAERTLVWSFNHTHIQCYAVMKLILKEYIKVKSREKSKDVLCSYFIKTFLFWQYEETDPAFWQKTKLRGCIMYLLLEFYKCIREGVLRHYFIPRFNLLEIKLTTETQMELLQLYDIVIQSDMAIMAQCVSLKSVWSKFVECRFRESSQIELKELKARQRFDFVEFLITTLYSNIMHLKNTLHDFLFCIEYAISAISGLAIMGNGQSPLAPFVLRHLFFLFVIEQLKPDVESKKSIYKILRILQNNCFGTDIARSELWGATFLVQSENYGMSLKYINNVLSSIPPYALYCSYHKIRTQLDAKRLYPHIFHTQEMDVLDTAREAWLFDIMISQGDYQFVPRAIQIEIFYSDPFTVVQFSPFTYAYYLMFLCYEGLGRYAKRDRALLQLVETVHSSDRCSYMRHHSYNIAGHCLLVAGHVDIARDMFLKSVQFTHCQRGLAHLNDRYNAAYHYLSYM